MLNAATNKVATLERMADLIRHGENVQVLQWVELAFGWVLKVIANFC
jgi:hypothetical protein